LQEQRQLQAAMAQSRREAEAARLAAQQVDRNYAQEIGLTPQQLAAMSEFFVIIRLATPHTHIYRYH
jgi:hypothetical protein